jgi:hypothetical protein
MKFTQDEIKYYLAFIVPIFLILLILLYRNTFFYRSKNLDSVKEHQKDIQMKNLDTCYELENDYQYKLCDYYIASSFQTPCLGNLHYDYVGIEPVIEIIKSGARYIEIPICQETVSLESEPVVATAELGKKTITSLNNLPLEDVFHKINEYSFKRDDATYVNYPLFIHLKIHTDNNFTLNSIADKISEIFENKYLNPKPYYQLPISLEKLCNLVNKVVFFGTGNYFHSKLKDIIVPTGELFQKLNYQELGKYNVKPDNFLTKEYGNLLSSKIQERNHQHFINHYQEIQDRVVSEEEMYDLESELKNDSMVVRQLNSFNKFGITIVYSNQSSDVISTNYDFMESFSYGCQFVCMNYIKNDDFIKKYVELFKESSFRLKPARLRYEKIEITLPDMNQDLTNQKVLESATLDNLNNNFLNKYLNKMITISPLAIPNNYLTAIENNLLFETKIGESKIDINNCFVVKKGESGNGISQIYLFSPVNNTVITINENNVFVLEKYNKLMMRQQHLYPINAVNLSNEPNDISFQLINPKTSLRLTYNNKTLRGVPKSVEPSVQNNSSFRVSEVNNSVIIRFITVDKRILKSYPTGNVVLLNDKLSKATQYIVKPIDKEKRSLIGDFFNLQNKNNDKYLMVDESGYLVEKPTLDTFMSQNYRFVLEEENGFIVIENQGRYLNKVKNQLQLKDKSKSIGTDKSFRIKVTYDLL